MQKESSDVIEDGQVVDINTTNLMTSQEVYIEDQALDLSVSTQDSPKAQPQARQEVALDLSLAGRKIKMSGKGVQKVVTRKRKASIKDADYIVKFGNYGLAGAPRTKRQMSLLLKNKKEEEKAKKSGGESDASKQHSMEDLVHAEILISLKRSTNESEDGEGEHMETDEDTDGSQDQDKDSVKGETENADDSSDKDSKEKEAGGMGVDDRVTVPLEDVMLNEEGIKKLGQKSAECKRCSKEEGKSEMTGTHDTEHKPEYLCGMCHHIFDQKDTYVTHLESHFPPIEVSSESGKQVVSGKTPHTCEICKLTFLSLKSLEHHNKNEHYTVIPMRISGDKDSMTMVVHPSSSLIMSSLKEAKESTADLLKMTAKIGKPEAHGVQGKDKTSKVTKEGNSSSVGVTGNAEDKMAEAKILATSLSEEEKGDSHGNDSVDGVPQTKATRSGIADLSEAKTQDAAKNQEESQLPAFSEIVRDVDEFFIKDVKTEKTMDNEKQDVDKEDGTVDTDPDASDMRYKEKRESTNVPDVVEKDAEEGESRNDTFRCMVCNKTFKDETFFEHMKVHSVYELAMSKIRIDKLKGNEISESSESGSKSSKFHCKLCNECFETFTELTSHFTYHLHRKVVHTRDIEITTEAKESDAPKKGRKRKNFQSPVIHKVLKEDKSSKEGKEDKGIKVTKEDKVAKEEKHKISKEGKSGKGTIEQKGNKRANEDKSKLAKEDSSSKVAKDAKSKNTSILAAALKTAPIYDVTGSVTAGSVPTAETEPTANGDNSDSQGNAAAKTNLIGIETSNVSFVSGSACGVGKQSIAADDSVLLVSKGAVSEGAQSVSAGTTTTPPTVTVLTPGMMQTYASKLLVQGMQTYLLNSTQPNVLSASVSPAVASSGQMRPQTVRVVSPATGMVTTKVPTMASSLGPVRLVTTDPKLSQQPQVILLKPGINLNAIPVQISSAVPSASVTQSMLVTAKTSTAQQETEKHQVPGGITAQLSNVAATVVPAVRQVLQQSSVQGSGIPQGGTKINIPWSVLQNISNISITPSTTLAATPGTISLGTAVATCSAGPIVATVPLVTNLPSPVTATAVTKVNPQVKSNLLNMMLARMSQPATGGQKPASSPVTVGLQASSLAGPKVSTIVQPQSSSDEAAQTVTRRDIKSALAQGLVVICSVCKTQLTSSDISNHSCSQARQSQPVTPPATASATSGASVSGSSVTQAGEEHSKPSDVTPTQTTAQMPGVHVSGGYIIGLPGKVTVTTPDIEEDVAEIVKKDPEKYLCIFRCSKCSFSAAKMESALQHTKLAHDPLPHPCRFLKLQVSSKSGKERKVGVSGQCKGCGLVMNVLEKQHIASPGESLLKPGTVKYKLASSIAAKRLDKAGIKTSGNSAVSTTEAESVTGRDTASKSKSRTLFTCPDCNSLFGSLFQLKQHKVIRHGSLPARRARVGLVQPHRLHRVERKFRDTRGHLNKASVKGHTKAASSKHDSGTTSISKTDQPPYVGSEKKDLKSEAMDKEETCDIENC